MVGGHKGLSSRGCVCHIIPYPHPSPPHCLWSWNTLGAARSEDLDSRLDSALCGTSSRLFSLSGPAFLLRNEGNH